MGGLVSIWKLDINLVPTLFDISFLWYHDQIRFKKISKPLIWATKLKISLMKTLVNFQRFQKIFFFSRKMRSSGAVACHKAYRNGQERTKMAKNSMKNAIIDMYYKNRNKNHIMLRQWLRWRLKWFNWTIQFWERCNNWSNHLYAVLAKQTHLYNKNILPYDFC